MLSVDWGGGGGQWATYNGKKASRDTTSGSFTITKENYELYSLFEQLYNDVETCNISDNGLDYLTGYEEQYKKLFNRETRTITWRTDDELENILTIKKEKETFELVFTMLPMQYCLRNPRNISIRFRTSGSDYGPFNMIFVRMYRKLRDIKNVDEDKLHDEEYMYRKEREKEWKRFY